MSNWFKNRILETAVDTFEQNCFMFPLDESEIQDTENAEYRLTEVCSVVEFYGAAKGGVKIRTSDDLMTALGANMLGIDCPSPQKKREALCEVTNIICGNIVPVFSKDSSICYLNPPKIIKYPSHLYDESSNYKVETICIYLDEGMAQIEVYYRSTEEV